MNDLNITISETAAKIILNTIEDQSVSDPYLAFYVAGGGCSGLQYGLALAEGEPEIDDIIIYDKGVKIAVENGMNSIELHARENAVPFYLSLQYTIMGNQFLEVNIPHYKMTKELDF